MVDKYLSMENYFVILASLKFDDGMRSTGGGYTTDS